MRRLTGAPSPSGPWPAARLTAGVALLLALSGCAGGSHGVRVEGGPASSEGPRAEASVVSTAPPGSPRSRSAGPGSGPAVTDALHLVRSDPKVSSEVKRQLRKPCSGDLWPVSVAFGRLTGEAKRDAVVNVVSCSDGLGLGSYVYRKDRGGTYENVFTREDRSVFAETEKGTLIVSKAVYVGDDPMCCPSGEVTTTYQWRDDKFRALTRQYADRSRKPTQSEKPPRGQPGEKPRPSTTPTPRPGSGAGSGG
ncbi:hypothetical protein E0L36_24140 [Streptomyces sp. AJS327]|uniref:hypothetical protein n=1 Tax=Streptomyces sp. AJS327 TaxID=2545265 RepID=UPI0015DFC454|nr:hypothetical protein [Streptomyces sp. AJS327]MBA0053833.1 hypothetical protein [Streptomyces sp. AJS327]